MQTKIYREIDEDDEMEITVQFHYSEGTNAYFDKSFGNWLPGDPPDFHILKATDSNGEPVDLTDEEASQVEDEAYDIYRDEVETAGEDAAIDRYEEMMEARWEREIEKY